MTETGFHRSLVKHPNVSIHVVSGCVLSGVFVSGGGSAQLAGGGLEPLLYRGVWRTRAALSGCVLVRRVSVLAWYQQAGTYSHTPDGSAVRRVPTDLRRDPLQTPQESRAELNVESLWGTTWRKDDNIHVNMHNAPVFKFISVCAMGILKVQSTQMWKFYHLHSKNLYFCLVI